MRWVVPRMSETLMNISKSLQRRCHSFMNARRFSFLPFGSANYTAAMTRVRFTKKELELELHKLMEIHDVKLVSEALNWEKVVNNSGTSLSIGCGKCYFNGRRCHQLTKGVPPCEIAKWPLGCTQYFEKL